MEVSDEDGDGKMEVIRERTTLHEWKSVVEVLSPRLLVNYNVVYDVLDSQPSCKFAVSKDGAQLALLSPNREISLFRMMDEKFELEAFLQMHRERYPEWCLVQFSDSGALLITTRNSPVIDVCDRNGGYYYSIFLNEDASDDVFDASTAISGMVSVACGTPENSKYFDTLYVLQFNGTLSAYNLGRVAIGFSQIFSVRLDHSIATCLEFVPNANLLIVGGQYNTKNVVEGDCTTAGLGMYRVVNEEPHVVDMKVGHTSVSWWEWIVGSIPFFGSRKAIIVSMSVSSDYSKLACISSTGDLFVYLLPSMRLANSFRYSGGMKPTQCAWMNNEKLAIFCDKGTLMVRSRGELSSDYGSLMPKEDDIVFSHCGKLVSQSGVIFLLEAKTSNEGNRALSKQSGRAWLAAKLRLTTFYDYFAVYAGAAVGQPLEDVQEARESRDVDYALHCVRPFTLAEMLIRMVKRGEFNEAIEVAEQHGIENMDFIYKEQWTKLGAAIKVDDVKNVLCKIRDADYVVNECTHGSVHSKRVQRAIVDLAVRVTESNADVKYAHALHVDRLLSWLIERGDYDEALFCKFRNESLLELTIYFAKKYMFDEVISLISENDVELIPHMFFIISMIPEAQWCSEISELLPRNIRGFFAFEPEMTTEWPLRQLAAKSEELRAVVSLFNNTCSVQPSEAVKALGSPEQWTTANVSEFLKARCYEIDKLGADPDLCVDFMKSCFENGFRHLASFLDGAELYRDTVLFGNGVPITLETFSDFDGDTIFDTVLKQVTEATAVKNMRFFVKLTEYLRRNGRCPDSAALLCKFLCRFSLKSLRALEAAIEISPDIPLATRIACFSECELSCRDLVKPAFNLGLPRSVSEGLKTFAKYRHVARFKEIYDSISSPQLASQLIYRLTRAAMCNTREEWRQLKINLLSLHRALYSSLFDEKTVLETIANKMLDYPDFSWEALHVVMTFERVPTEPGAHLSVADSVQVIVDKSNELLNSATCDLDNALLNRARVLLSLAMWRDSDVVAKAVKMLDALELGIRMGLTMLPLNFRLAAPDHLLQMVVQIGDNYKKPMDCGKFAELLGMESPVARAMQLCTARALAANDQRTVRQYIVPILNSAKCLPGIQSLLAEILCRNYVPEMRREIAALALMTSADHDLEATVRLARGSTSADEGGLGIATGGGGIGSATGWGGIGSATGWGGFGSATGGGGIGSATGGGGTGSAAGGGGTGSAAGGGGTGSAAGGGGSRSAAGGGGTGSATGGGGTGSVAGRGGSGSAAGGGGTDSPTSGVGTDSAVSGGGTESAADGGGGEIGADLSVDVVRDPMYTSLPTYLVSQPRSGARFSVAVGTLVRPVLQFANIVGKEADNWSRIVERFSHGSATLSLAVKLLCSDDEEWWKNLFMQKYDRSLASLLYGHKLVMEDVPMLSVEHLAKNSSISAGFTPMERILSFGCDEERFFSYARYRNDFLAELAKTVEEAVLNDCIEVADSIGEGGGELKLCCIALENALTNPRVKPEDAAKLLSSKSMRRRLLGKLKSQIFDFVFKKILPLVTKVDTDRERVILYLSLFEGSGFPEGRCLSAAQGISAIIGEQFFPLLVSRNPEAIAKLLLPYFDASSDVLSPLLLQLPMGHEIRSEALRLILTVNRSNPLHLRTCFHLLEKNAALFVPYIALNVPDEEEYIAQSLTNCVIEEEMKCLRDVMVDRVAVVRRQKMSSAGGNLGEASSSFTLRRRHH